jgi:hypothetical protein
MLSEAIDFEMNAHDEKGDQISFCEYRLIGCGQMITINSAKY